MGRPPLVQVPQILAAAREIAWERGCANVTVTDVAVRLGRPSGSLYHRFAGRDELLAQTWLEAVQHFQSGYIAALGNDDPLSATREAARHVLQWCRDEPQRAGVLLWFRQSDLLTGTWPAYVVETAEKVNTRLEQALSRLGRRAGCSPRRLTMAAIDVPYAVARRRLQEGGATAEDEALVDEVVESLLRDRTS